MSRQRKRNRREFEQDRSEATNRFGMGQTLSILRQDSAGASDALIQQPEDSGGEWQTVARKKQKRDDKNSTSSPKSRDANYPAIKHSPHAGPQKQVRLCDLQALVLYLLADGPSPQWVAVQHHKHIKKVVALMVPGLDRGMFDQSIVLGNNGSSTNEKNSSSANTFTAMNPPVLSNAQGNRSFSSPDEYYPSRLNLDDLPGPLKPLADVFDYMWPVKAPGDDRGARLHSPMSAMLMAQLPKSQEYQKHKGPKPPRESNGWKDQQTPVSTFVASVTDLRDNGFVIHQALLTNDEDRKFEAEKRQREQKTSDNGWIDSAVTNIEHTELSRAWNVLAMDCEMCQTKLDQFELTRISIVRWDGELVLDELVKPDEPITDYLTVYSGITKEILDPITTTLADIQKRLLTLLTPQTILLGHSLDSDLNALKLTHPAIIDTSILYPHPRGPPLKSSLKYLAGKYLQRNIQKGTDGHDSVEDARATLDLVKLKCDRGPTWGTPEASMESLFKRIGRSKRLTKPEEARTGAVVDWGFPKRGYGASADACIGCENDDDVVEGIKRAVFGDQDGGEIAGGGVDFTWGRMRGLEALRGWWNGSKTADNEVLLEKARASSTSASDNHTGGNEIARKSESSKLLDSVTNTISRIKEIYDFLPPCTALIVYSGTGDPKELSRLQGIRETFNKEFKIKKWDQLSVHWTDVEEQAIKAAYSEARQGIAFLTVK